MRTLLLSLVLLLAVPTACAGIAVPDGAVPDEAAMAQTETSHALSQQSEGIWAVQAEVSLAGQSSSAEVAFSAEAEPSADAPPHLALAQAKAWLALGADLFAAGGASDAMQAAQQGVTALGTSYRVPPTKDDTGMKLRAADQLVKEGQMASAAQMVLDVLHQRVEMYGQRYAAILKS